MKPGVSTYAYFWRELTLLEMLEDVARLGGEIFQICDYPALEDTDECGRRELAAAARAAGVELELGTRGTHPDHLARYLRYAEELGARLLRTMVTGPTWGLSEVLPRFERSGVTIALENYEQISTTELVGIVQRIAHPNLGICLDPGNSVAALELPEQVIERLAPHVVNLHVKDFKFARREGWVGFTLAGAPLGTGLLDLDATLATLRAHGRDPNAIIELWVPQELRTIEAEWAESSLATLRRELSHPRAGAPAAA
jgi:sugar phosphate isomerase/epimerase